MVVDGCVGCLGEVVEGGGAFACDIHSYHFLVCIDDAEHGLQLQQGHIAVCPVGDGVLLSQHVFVDGDVYGLMYQLANL